KAASGTRGGLWDRTGWRGWCDFVRFAREHWEASDLRFVVATTVVVRALVEVEVGLRGFEVRPEEFEGGLEFNFSGG
ncbi:MAG: hypothetical protein QF570_12190, partial [Myxococcota bacterium]|nr:hypothetical protein [Myxococcota bacterium]